MVDGRWSNLACREGVTGGMVGAYKLQSDFPKYETYALCDQIRRAVVSIPTNIAEGNARQYEKERRQFFTSHSEV